jgi:chromosome segregation ATPase
MEARIATIEANYLRLLENTHATADALERHAERSSEAIEGLISKLAAAKVPQWGALASWAAVILTIVGLLLASINRDQAKISTELDKQREQIEVLKEKLSSMSTEVAELKTRQQITTDVILPDMLDKIKQTK